MTDQQRRNRDGSTMGANEYVTLALCIIVPIIGLLFAGYAKQQGESWAGRALVVGVIALAVWIGLVLFL